MKNQKTILYVAGIAAGYFLILKPILEKLGITKSIQEIKSEENIQSYIQSATKNTKPTKSKGEWQIIANQIYEDLRYSALDDNKNDAQYQVSRVKNEADIATLIEVFGLRQEYAFGIPIGSKKDLQQFVRSNLSTAQILAINNNYSRKGIKYRF
jgi:hypothetical protein